MSYRPKGFGANDPMGVVRIVPGGFLRGSAKLPPLAAAAASSPEEKRVVVPARQAYSHSASVGRR